MKKRIKWWLFPVILVLIILIGSAVLWPTLRVYLAPKTVLAAALTDMYGKFETRMENNPLLLIAKTLDMEAGNTIEMDLTTQSDLLGTVHYDMDIQKQWSPSRVYARGQVTAQGKPLDLAIYLDSRFAALSSAGILKGNFYGLTYDTFSEDIRSKHLLSLVAGESTLRDWEEKVSALQEIMSKDVRLPEFSQADFRNLLIGIMALHPEVERERVDVNGSMREYFEISFEADGSAVASGLDLLNMSLPVRLDPNEDVDISFWIYENTVAKIRVEAGDQKLAVYPDLSAAAETSSDDILVEYVNAGRTWTARVHTRQDAVSYQETIAVTGEEALTVAYRWDIAAGDLVVQCNRKGEEDTVSLNLLPTETGFRMETGDFESMMHMLTGAKDSADSPCTVIVAKGAEFTTPEYKNFSDWSLEDLVTLLSGVGSLLGIKLA